MNDCLSAIRKCVTHSAFDLTSEHPNFFIFKDSKREAKQTDFVSRMLVLVTIIIKQTPPGVFYKTKGMQSHDGPQCFRLRIPCYSFLIQPLLHYTQPGGAIWTTVNTFC